MAEEKKKAGRPPKSTTDIDVAETKPIKNTEEKEDLTAVVANLMKQISDLQNKLAEKENESKNNDSISGFSNKKVKVVNIMYNPLNISTEPNGGGRTYTFENHGDTRFIKFDDLVEIVASYPYTMEHGFAYICDRTAVEALGLVEEYNKLYDEKTMNEIIMLHDDIALEMFLNTDIALQRSMAKEIAKRMVANEYYDLNYLNKIKEKTQIDVDLIVKDIKENSQKKEEE